MYRLTVDYCSDYCGFCSIHYLSTERDARQVVNATCDGQCTYRIYDPAGELLIETRFPVLMVA